MRSKGQARRTPATRRLTTSTLRRDLAETIDRVSRNGTRLVVTRNRQEVAALVSIDDLELLRAIEDRIDIEAAREALADPERIPWKQVKRRLGL
jgi:prevent-host-death family protein